MHKVRFPHGPGLQLTPSVVPQYLHQSIPDFVKVWKIVGDWVGRGDVTSSPSISLDSSTGVAKHCGGLSIGNEAGVFAPLDRFDEGLEVFEDCFPLLKL